MLGMECILRRNDTNVQCYTEVKAERCTTPGFSTRVSFSNSILPKGEESAVRLADNRPVSTNLQQPCPTSASLICALRLDVV
jgi:hypothetical protein